MGLSQSYITEVQYSQSSCRDERREQQKKEDVTLNKREMTRITNV